MAHPKRAVRAFVSGRREFKAHKLALNSKAEAKHDFRRAEPPICGGSLAELDRQLAALDVAQRLILAGR